MYIARKESEVLTFKKKLTIEKGGGVSHSTQGHTYGG